MTGLQAEFNIASQVVIAKNTSGQEHCSLSRQNIPTKCGVQHNTNVPTTINNVFAALVSRRMVTRAWTSFLFRSFSIAKEDLLNTLNELGLENFTIEAVENRFFLVRVGVIASSL